MMQEYNDGEIPPPVPSGGPEKDTAEVVIDTVCDPFGLVPDNLEAAFAHNKKMKLEAAKEEELKAKEEAEALAKAEAEALAKAEAEAAAPKEEKDSAYFNLDCCGKNPPATEEIEDKEFPAEKLPVDEDPDGMDELDQILGSGESASVMTGNNSQQLAEIAAKMDEIDLETAAGDTTADQLSIDSLQKGNTDWYKEPLYATLIVLSGLFSIMIVVFAVLLIAD
mmetsp:Transcript_4992/g.11922  ORF Transcript_4992/g.11922 Transcript_4992/m.11922 type:complete len:223 (+) Transcript_4992:114-782(+)|eukprot:CAMPEP_0116089864 /NCGR_PEP_ID=MMETSP0327-20121206/6646_1 /TAXON_ID=44447 /ORGANISM="Pseudo-nitzschia delicatissima, Strain B596" /LENGTH=222 /DNA_ID=CAMNT_0003581071 /DNA_START=58 /DNA_END=726 /DNA_ORIENTATION=-